MQIEILDHAGAVAKKAAAFIAHEARMAVEARGRFILALSGGRTPWMMLRELVNEEVPWNELHLFQVDERVAPLGNPDRNLTHITECLLSRVPVRPDQMHAMPVDSSDLVAAAISYSKTLTMVAGLPPILDLVHLGLGPDGHTASLVPGDSALELNNCDVAITGIYQGHQRMTLTFPLINRSRRILWVVTGEEKAVALGQLIDRDQSIPAGRITQDRGVVIAELGAVNRMQTNRDIHSN